MADHDVIFRQGLELGLKMTEFTSSDYSPQCCVCVCVCACLHVCVGLRLTNPIQCLKQVPLRTGFLQTNRVRLGSVRVFVI